MDELIVSVKKHKNDFPISLFAIKASHDIHRAEYIQSLRFLSMEQLINKIYIEINAKNKAYIFILENGLCDAFMNYSGISRLSDKFITDFDFYSKSKEQLINDLIFNMDAKNQAYYFIIESGHFYSF